MRIVALQDSVEFAVPANALEETRHFFMQRAVLALRQSPLQRLWLSDIESDAQIRIETPVEIHNVGVCDGVLDAVFLEQQKQLLYIHVR